MNPVRPRIALFADQFGFDTAVPILGNHLAAIVSSSPLAPTDHVPQDAQFLLQERDSESSPDGLLQHLSDLDLDALVCFSYSLKIPQSLISLPRLDAVNIHGALLPECRGANVLNWVLVKDHSETGCTMHHLSDVIDNGDIAYRDTIPITDDDDALTLRSKIAIAAQLQLHKALAVWLQRDRLPRAPQDSSLACRYRRRTPDDGLFDWSYSDRQIFNLVRALVKPWPGARFVSNGRLHVIDRRLTLNEVAELRRIHSP